MEVSKDRKKRRVKSWKKWIDRIMKIKEEKYMRTLTQNIESGGSDNEQNIYQFFDRFCYIFTDLI